MYFELSDQRVFCFPSYWRDARVAEWGGLENRYTRKGIEGSNPSLSAYFDFYLLRISLYIVVVNKRFMERMKSIIKSVLLVSALVFTGCGEDEPDPKVIKNTKLLAGNKGDSKSWVITSFVIKDGGSSTDIFDEMDVCITDNIFTFSNSANQEFEQTEGSTKCLVDDPSVIESGTWYLTTNGLKFTVLVLFDDVNNEDSALFAYFPYTWAIVELSGSTLVIEYEDSDGILWTITFEAV